MKNMIDYVLETGALAWDAKPFCAADSVVLCQLAYLDWRNIAPSPDKPKDSMRLADAIVLGGIRPLCATYFLPELNERLLFAVLESGRFREIRIHAHVDESDPETEKQFSAVSFTLPTGAGYVAFRGTDATLNGWKEDFNMAYRCPVPAQESAVAYLDRVAKGMGTPLLVGGHSKGGNLAVYAAMKCTPETRRKLRGVYNHDGPGFRETVLADPGFQSIAGMLQTILPQASVVGMLLQHDNRYRVVESTAVGLLQHNQFSWRIEDGDLRYAAQLAPSAALFGRTLDTWLADLDDERRERFGETLFHVLEASGLQNLKNPERGWRKAAADAAKALQDIDPETRRFIIEVFRLFLEAARERVAEKVKESLSGRNGLMQRLGELMPGMGKSKADTSAQKGSNRI